MGEFHIFILFVVIRLVFRTAFAPLRRKAMQTQIVIFNIIKKSNVFTLYFIYIYKPYYKLIFFS